VTDEAAFLAAIIERPDDDVPRLVFADWLDEHGQPERAEFVRVQVELAALPGCPVCGNSGVYQKTVTRWIDGLGECGVGSRPAPCWKCPRHALRRREGELLEYPQRLQGGEPPQGLGWTCGYDDTPNGRRFSWLALDGPGEPIGYTFSRGFVSAVTLGWGDWVRHAAALLNAAPIRRVNRPRECGECQGDCWVPRLSHRRVCLACRGTGRVDVWAGDGRVRLTTWPEWADPCFKSEWFVGIRRGILADADRLRILGLAFPGVSFELPAAGGYGPSDLREPMRRAMAPPRLPDREAVRLIAAAHGRPDPFAAVTPEARP
jgi:uncharacterized protein (TIGR02996 family)